MYINLRVLGDIGDQLLDLANLEGRDLLNIAQVLHNEFRPTIEVFWKTTLFILSSSRLAREIEMELRGEVQMQSHMRGILRCTEPYSTRT